MASPCEVLVECGNRRRTRRLTEIAAREVRRIEVKFSRYRDDSVLGRLHAAAGEPFEVDAETAELFDFAARCHAISGGAFDVTSGVLRRAWRFDGSDRSAMSRATYTREWDIAPDGKRFLVTKGASAGAERRRTPRSSVRGSSGDGLESRKPGSAGRRSPSDCMALAPGWRRWDCA